MKKLAFIDSDNNIEVHNFDGDWLELWERGWRYEVVKMGGGDVEVKVIDDCLMVVGEEGKVLENAKKVLKAEIG